MRRQATGLITLACFLLLSLSCYAIHPIKPERLSPDSEIRKVEKKSGDIIEFSEAHPGAFENKMITGNGVLTRASGIDSSDWIYAKIQISISEVSKAWVKKFDIGSTLFFTALICTPLAFLAHSLKDLGRIGGFQRQRS